MVYVDNFNAPFGRMKMCHLIADSQTELLEFVSKIGVNKKWIQYEGTSKEHFDICLSKKKKAIENGAVEINFRELSAKTQNREWKK
jgi:poly-D-alanine transfer protein DltD